MHQAGVLCPSTWTVGADATSEGTWVEADATIDTKTKPNEDILIVLVTQTGMKLSSVRLSRHLLRKLTAIFHSIIMFKFDMHHALHNIHVCTYTIIMHTITH